MVQLPFLRLRKGWEWCRYMQGFIGLPRWRLRADWAGAFSLASMVAVEPEPASLRSWFSWLVAMNALPHLSPCWTQFRHHLLRGICPFHVPPNSHFWAMWVSLFRGASILRVLNPSQYIQLLFYTSTSVWRLWPFSSSKPSSCTVPDTNILNMGTVAGHSHNHWHHAFWGSTFAFLFQSNETC